MFLVSEISSVGTLSSRSSGTKNSNESNRQTVADNTKGYIPTSHNNIAHDIFPYIHGFYRGLASAFRLTLKQSNK